MSKLRVGEIDSILDLIFKEKTKRITPHQNKDDSFYINVKSRVPTAEIPAYTDLLRYRHLSKQELPGLNLPIVRHVRSVFRQENMVVLLLGGIIVITVLSVASSCWGSRGWAPGCQVHTRTEFYDIQLLGRVNDKTSLQADPTIETRAVPPESIPQNFTKNRVEISKSESLSHYFNLEIFKNLVLAYSLLLAFIRWHLTNLQSGMSEIFERKRSVNNLIMTNKSDVEDLVSGALEFSNTPKSSLLAGPICRNRFAEIIHECAEDTPFGDKGPSFIQQMFVFIELDNLELALKKYKDGYLEAEQMYRACEIFESRCMTKYFRYLAANQGLRNYTLGFHKLLVVLLVFGYYKEPIAEDASKPKGCAS